MTRKQIKRAAASIIALREAEGIRTIRSRPMYTRDHYELEVSRIRREGIGYANLHGRKPA